jgi:cystathionine beta-synthase/cysteine synthase A
MFTRALEPDASPAEAITAFDAIGDTPMVRLSRMFPGPAAVYAKLEYYNPSGSIKDRIAHHIIKEAERSGDLKAGGTIVEGTSGNTGAAIAAIAAARGYRAILTMPAKASAEKQNAPRAYGAEVIICPAVPPDSPEHYMQKANSIVRSIPGAFMVNQYNNLKNAEAHYLTTGPEIWRQSQGQIDYFVASASTGGTISGAGRYVKERNPDLKVLMLDPIGSVYAHYFKTGEIDPEALGPYELEGIGKDHIVNCMDFNVVDEVMQLSDKEAFDAARELAAREGVLGGGSGGANIWGCMQLAKRIDSPATIVTIIPDSGLKYLTKFYNDDWLAKATYTGSGDS